MAGLPNFATYFGRDMMMTALMMRPIWTPAMSEHVIASVLLKLGPGGDVSHEEALGGQAIRENAVVYDSLVRAGRIDSARRVLADLQATRENYHMIDDEFQLPVLAARYLADTAVAAARKREFLLDDAGGCLPSRRAVARAGSRRHVDAALCHGAEADQPGQLSATRPHALALRELARQRCGIRRRSVRDGRERHLGPAGARGHGTDPGFSGTAGLPPRGTGLDRSGDPRHRPGRVRRVIPARSPVRWSIWRRAWRHFEVTLSPAEIRERVRARLAALPPGERRLLGES